jgi:hypothetical protein
MLTRLHSSFWQHQKPQAHSLQSSNVPLVLDAMLNNGQNFFGCGLGVSFTLEFGISYLLYVSVRYTIHVEEYKRFGTFYTFFHARFYFQHHKKRYRIFGNNSFSYRNTLFGIFVKKREDRNRFDVLLKCLSVCR